MQNKEEEETDEKQNTAEDIQEISKSKGKKKLHQDMKEN